MKRRKPTKDEINAGLAAENCFLAAAQQNFYVIPANQSVKALKRRKQTFDSDIKQFDFNIQRKADDPSQGFNVNVEVKASRYYQWSRKKTKFEGFGLNEHEFARLQNLRKKVGTPVFLAFYGRHKSEIKYGEFWMISLDDIEEKSDGSIVLITSPKDTWYQISIGQMLPKFEIFEEYTHKLSPDAVADLEESKSTKYPVVSNLSDQEVNELIKSAQKNEGHEETEAFTSLLDLGRHISLWSILTVLLLDWIIFSGALASFGLGLPVLTGIGFVLAAVSVFLIQRYESRDSMLSSILKSLGCGLLVGIPTPITGTVLAALKFVRT